MHDKGSAFCKKIVYCLNMGRMIPKKRIYLTFVLLALTLTACKTEDADIVVTDGAIEVTSVDAQAEGEEADITEGDEIAEDEFYISEITDDIFLRIEGKSFKSDCSLPREDLRYLHLLHKNLEGETLEGEMMVNVHIADDVLEIFRELYEIGYPIEKIRLIDEYDADDELSMEDNNSSSFNFRTVSGTGKISKHGLGMAIDINPFYNPYIRNTSSGVVIEPYGSEMYADRSSDFDYKIDTDDEAYRIFTEHGFFWGGAWKNQKDYQHFEIPTEEIRKYYSWY